MPVIFERRGDASIVTIDNPPVNAISQQIRAGLLAAIDKAVVAGVRRLVVTGNGRIFAAGADAREFDAPPQPPHLNDVLKRLASCPLPTVAAIQGAALGGGLEIALACRVRIGSPKATLGLPEVTLGVVPGAGGTQRLPRLVGMRAALDMIATGKPLDAAQALAAGLLDSIEEDPLAATLVLNEAALKSQVVADDRPAVPLDEKAVSDARLRAAKSPHLVAPAKAITLVAASAAMPIDQAMAEERRTFLALRNSEQAKALRHVFFAETSAAARASAFAAKGKQVSTAVVVGGGSMGSGIAYALAGVGISVTIVETDDSAVERAKSNTDRLVTEGVKRKALSADVASDILGRLRHTRGFAGLPKADLAIEAAFEDIFVKREIFASLQSTLPVDTILASNTSYLDINEIAAGIDRPERFLGLHFFNPAHLMELLEIIPGQATGEGALGTAFSLAKRLKKIAIPAGICDGFIGNRILARYRQVADILLLEGAMPHDVDDAMRSFGIAMGPYEAQDLSGLDIAYANRQRLKRSGRRDARYIPIADRMVEQFKRLGRKTQAGWYDYPDGKPVISDEVKGMIEATSREMGVARHDFGKDEIAERLTLAMVAEAAELLSEGIAQFPKDIDLVMIHGYGFPRWRGGLMYAAGLQDPKDLVNRIEALEAADPSSWQVPSLLRAMAAGGTTFKSLNIAAER